MSLIIKTILLLAFAILAIRSEIAQGYRSTTYIIDVQKERYDTRWTLTEWLRIKERMRLMDVWLAMFSSPKQDVFKPEFSLTYANLNGLINHQNRTTGASAQYQQTSQFKQAQIWLTNIVTATTKIRTLNIDFGIEGAERKSSPLTEIPGLATGQALGTSPIDRHWSANFRVFGKNIQDSSLVLKVGQYQYFNHPGWSEDQFQDLQGSMVGADLNLYLIKWLGFEGHYRKYGDANSVQSQAISGSYLDYLAYIEIALFRFMFGAYQESFLINQGDTEQKTDGGGVLTGIKVQF